MVWGFEKVESGKLFFVILNELLGEEESIGVQNDMTRVFFMKEKKLKI